MDRTVINESPKFSGLGRYARDLSIALSARLLTLNLDSSLNDSVFEGTLFRQKNIIKFGNGWYINHRFPSFALREIGNQIRKEVSSASILHYASQLVPCLNLENRYLYTVHDLFGLNPKYSRNKRLRKLIKLNLKRIIMADKIITVSNYVRSELESLVNSEKIVTIYPPVSESFTRMYDKPALRKLLGLPLDKKLVLSVSSDNPRKNLQATKETITKLGDKFRLVRVGKAIENSYSFEKIDDEKLNLIYNACDVLLFPSLDEGFGFPLAEAMTVGLPAVVSDIPIFREIAGNGAELVEPVPHALAKRIREVIDSKDSLIERGLKVAGRYSFKTFKETVNSFYNNL